MPFLIGFNIRAKEKIPQRTNQCLGTEKENDRKMQNQNGIESQEYTIKLLKDLPSTFMHQISFD